MNNPSAFPIDLVYLWVDGSDPTWLAKKNAALEATNEQVHQSAKSSDRFDDKEELRFSLRSVETNMPWVNHIYIITDNQVPRWLNIANPRISVIDHRDIVPAEFLPTFNSLTVELFSHRIPGLSEHYILANDDYFAGSPLTPEFFFNESGDPVVIVREKRYLQNIFSAIGFENVSQRRKLIGRRILNALRLVFELTGKRYYMFICHSMEPMRKSYAENIVSQHGDKFIRDTSTTFRDRKNIQRIFFPLYNHAQGRTELVADWRFYRQRVPLSFDASWPGILWRDILWTLPFFYHDYVDVKDNVYNTISRAKPATFCINSSVTFARVTGDMEKLFPQKSEFEK